MDGRPSTPGRDPGRVGRPPHRAVGALGRLRDAGRAGGGGGALGRLAPRRRHGRALRPQRDDRAPGGGLAAPPHAAVLRLPPDDDRPGPLPEGLRRRRCRRLHGARRDRRHRRADRADARASGLRAGLALNPDTPVRRGAALPARRRPRAVHDGVPRLRRPELHRRRHGQGGAGARRGRRRRARRSTSRWTAASTPTTAPVAAAAGANVFVAGSAIFGHERPWEAADAIRAVGARRRRRR